MYTKASNIAQSKDRVILHFDFDCFYASCVEKHDPKLKQLPLAIQQKHIIVTCNYIARRYGLRKLQTISDAKRKCPELIVVLGEDLTLFRNESKANFLLLRECSWNKRIEKLGFDELFLDVTDQINFNLEKLGAKDQVGKGFFQTSAEDPSQGFEFDWNHIPGTIHPRIDASQEVQLEKVPKGLLLGSHLAFYLRRKLLEQQGFTCSVGISTSKLMAKLSGTVHKPNQQTLLLPESVQDFLDIHEISKIPGIGSKTARILRDAVQDLRAKEAKEYQNSLLEELNCSNWSQAHDLHHEDDNIAREAGERMYADREDEKMKQLAKDDAWRTYYGDAEVTLKVKEARTLLSRAKVDTLFGGNSVPNSARVWELLHGLDTTDVLTASEIPSTISIEDTFRENTMCDVDSARAVMIRLCRSLIKRMHIDLLVDPLTDETFPALTDAQWNDALLKAKWMAYPKTIRLSTRDRNVTKFGARTSKSMALPSIIFSLKTEVHLICEKLVGETLMPMFKKLHTGKFNLALINIGVTNMSDGENGSGGSDVSAMFKRYNEVFPEGDWERKKGNVNKMDSHNSPDDAFDDGFLSDDEDLQRSSNNGFEVSTPVLVCEVCGVGMPYFAIGAHEVFHKLENG